jgi:hypothetical protein
MNTRAKWVEGVRDLYPNHLDEANNYFGVPAVAEQTGLSPSTIKDLLSRVPITSETNVLAPISRPACRIGNQPLYSQEQIDKVTERQRATGHRHLGGGDAPLSSITPAEARKRNLVSVEEIAEMANAQNPDGVHEQTVRRWARDADDVPPAVALRSREGGHPGVPKVVRERKKVAAWLVKHGYRKNESGGRSRAARTS